MARSARKLRSYYHINIYIYIYNMDEGWLNSIQYYILCYEPRHFMDEGMTKVHTVYNRRLFSVALDVTNNIEEVIISSERILASLQLF